MMMTDHCYGSSADIKPVIDDDIPVILYCLMTNVANDDRYLT